MPTILSIIQLRSTIASVIKNVDGTNVRIGDKLPHSVWHSLELATVVGPLGHKLYADIHRKCPPQLRLEIDLKDQDQAQVTALRDHRRLSQAVLHLRADTFKNPSSAAQAPKHDSDEYDSDDYQSDDDDDDTTYTATLIRNACTHNLMGRPCNKLQSDCQYRFSLRIRSYQCDQALVFDRRQPTVHEAHVQSTQPGSVSDNSDDTLEATIVVRVRV